MGCPNRELNKDKKRDNIKISKKITYVSFIYEIKLLQRIVISYRQKIFLRKILFFKRVCHIFGGK